MVSQSLAEWSEAIEDQSSGGRTSGEVTRSEANRYNPGRSSVAERSEANHPDLSGAAKSVGSVRKMHSLIGDRTVLSIKGRTVAKRRGEVTLDWEDLAVALFRVVNASRTVEGRGEEPNGIKIGRREPNGITIGRREPYGRRSYFTGKDKKLLAFKEIMQTRKLSHKFYLSIRPPPKPPDRKLQVVASGKENEAPGWTQLKLPGQAPSPRCGHTVTSGGHYLLMFGGHGTGGWLSRYDIYYNDCIILDRVSAQWKRLSIGSEPPPARAYHSMSVVGSRYLLIGGFDGKTTYGDPWWLVPQEDPIANRLTASPPRNIPESKEFAFNDDFQPQVKESQTEKFPFSELQRRLQISVSSSSLEIVNEFEDKELLEVASRLAGENVSTNSLAIETIRKHWRKSEPNMVKLKELGPLLRDYQRLIYRHYLERSASAQTPGFGEHVMYQFYHVKNATQLRMDDIPKLLAEYKQLPI
ncbi:hypothetical protein LR48_Vigan02g180700 [Vigna angularis]|uniref:Uncharacterized protein n=1 Tax=Phaseolus angularis TaxID=3914 RepID=A0A0L9TZ31_PHAAN|nr:hypothetical protein LR48_Vigan02g180700 [Vigna angularis]